MAPALGVHTQMRIVKHIDLDDHASVRCFATLFTWRPLLFHKFSDAVHLALADEHLALPAFLEDLEAVLRIVKQPRLFRSVKEAVNKRNLSVLKVLMRFATDKDASLAFYQASNQRIAFDEGVKFIVNNRTVDETMGLVGAATAGNLDLVKFFVSRGVKPALWSAMITHVAMHGQDRVIAYLLQFVEPGASLVTAAFNAIVYGHAPAFKTLLPHIDLRRCGSTLLRCATETRCADVVNLLLPLLDDDPLDGLPSSRTANAGM